MNMCPTNKCKSTPESCLKGQVFFLVTNCSNQEILKTRISLLGGKVEEFLSKDVTTLLVEDNQLVGQELLPDLSVKTTYNTVNGTFVASFPYPTTLTNIPSTSRGYNILATNTSNKYAPYRLICYARQYGIQVLTIAQFLTWTEPQIKVIRQKQPRKAASDNVSNLSGYFIKFESVNKNYRPCYKMFNANPDRLVPLKNASVLVKPETCNVILNKPAVVTKFNHIQFNHMDSVVRPIHQVKGANLPVKVNDKKPQNNRPRPKEDNNYCECCKTHFADFKAHIKSSKHQTFVSNDKNYESVHNILKMLPTAQEFIESLQKPSPNSDPTLTNGDSSATMPVANVPETDYSVPLNLEVRRENVTGTAIQLNTPIVKNDNGNNQEVKKEEIMPLPLDLHIKRNDEIKTENKQKANLYDNSQQIGLCKKEEIDLLQIKQEPDNEIVMGNVKVDEKQPELLDVIQCDDANGGDLFDKTNTAALAQLCLKNFDSYWLDSLPCEVEDMEFDDIFAFDDGKTKIDDVGFEPFVDNIINSEIPQTPGLVSGISNSNLKTDNASIFMNTSVDVKDFNKTEPPNQENFLSTCKLGKENETSVSPLNVTVSLNETLSLENKKPIFSIASFCSDKIGIEATPSCSNTIPSKNLEPLFSSESSDDDENGNVLISNALNFITNSDNEGKLDKESSEENSLPEKFRVNTLLKKDNAMSKSKSNQPETRLSSAKNSLNANQTDTPVLFKKNSSAVQSSPVIEINMSTKSNNTMNNDSINRGKVSFQSSEDVSKINTYKNSPEKCKVYNDKECKNINLSYDNSINNQSKIESACITNTDAQKRVSNISIHHTSELPSSNIKNDSEKHKETNLLEKEKEWDYTCNKIYKKYPIPLNRSSDNSKVVNEKSSDKDKEVSGSLQNKCLEETKTNKKSSEKYPNPKKNISMREMAVKQNNSATNTHEDINQSGHSAVTSIKNGCSKEINSSKVEKKNEINTDKKEINTASAKIVPVERKVDQISFKPYITDENITTRDKKISHDAKQNLKRNDLSVPYSNWHSSKPSACESKSGQASCTDINPVKNIFSSETKSHQEKQELIYSTVNPSNTDIHSMNSSNKNDFPNSLSLRKNENQSNNAASPVVKNYSLESEVATKPATVNCPIISPNTIKSVSFENRMNNGNYNITAHQNVLPEGKVHKTQPPERTLNLSTVDLSCLSMSSVIDTNRTNKPYCGVVTSTKPEEKVPKENKGNSGINNVLNTSIPSVNQTSGVSKTSFTKNLPAIGESHKKVDSVTDFISIVPDKNINSLNSDVTSGKTIHIPEEKNSVKKTNNPPKKINQNIPNTNVVSKQVPHSDAPDILSHNVSAASKSLVSQGEELSQKEDKTVISLDLSHSKTVDLIHKKNSKPYGDFTSIKNLISQHKSPGERKCYPDEQVCSSSFKRSSDSRSLVSNELDLKQCPSTIIDSITNPLLSEKHSNDIRQKSEANASSKINIVSQEPVSLVGIQNQISCDAPLHAKNLQMQEKIDKKRAGIQANVKLNISNTGISGNAFQRKNNSNQSSNLSKSTILEQDQSCRKRKRHSRFNTSFNSGNVPHGEKKEHCTNYEYFIPFKRKKTHRKEKKIRKKMKSSSISVNKHTVSEVSARNYKGQLSKSMTNKCQYSYRTAKYNMDTSSALPVKSSMAKQTLKIPHKKQSPKLRELPPLWTVAVNGVKLKFTRIYPKKIDTYQYVTEDDSD